VIKENLESQEHAVPASTNSKQDASVTIFETHVTLRTDNVADITSGDNPKLRVSPPPEFGGPSGTWSPEQLFVASIESCLMSTCTYFTNRFDAHMASYSSSCRGTLEKRQEGLRFSKIEVSITVKFSDEQAMSKAESLRLRQKLEKYCPVSAALNCPVLIDLKLVYEENPP